MSSTDGHELLWLKTTPPNVPHSTIINLVNLLMRETAHRITVLERARGPDPELYVVTRVDWRDSDPDKPILPQLPRLLSMLETLRGTRGVPKEVRLSNSEGVAVYLPTEVRVSTLSNDPKTAVQELMDIIEESLMYFLSTIKEVETWFWKAARQKGFSPKIVECMARKEPGFNSRELAIRFQSVLHKYFSLKFRIFNAEETLRVEEDY
ncbi:MAG: hypothetical protein ACFFCP_05515 [Promethearchaeota archaeon]